MSAANSDRRKRRALRKSVSSKVPRVTEKTLNINSGTGEERNPGLGASWYAGSPMTTPDDIARVAREHFVQWIDFYLEAFPTECGGEPDGKGSQEQLAERMGISAPAISMWRKKGSTRYPNLRNVIRFHALINKVYVVHLDTILFGPPPTLPRRR
jgi:hypothetical protein